LTTAFLFQKTDHVHTYFDVAAFPYDFESNRNKDEAKTIEIDATIGWSPINNITIFK
jgi:hypothetical protein